MTSKPKKPADLDSVLLCLIRMHPDISGYQLRSIINDSTGYFFHAHLSQIYPALRRLTEAGMLVFSNVERDSQPDLKLYRTTDAGDSASHEWLCQPFEFERTRTSIDRYFLKLILMGHLEPQEIVAYIDQGIEALSGYRESIGKEDLGIESVFVSDLEEKYRDRYLRLWNREFGYILHELDERVRLLRALRAEFADEA